MNANCAEVFPRGWRKFPGAYRRFPLGGELHRPRWLVTRSIDAPGLWDGFSDGRLIATASTPEAVMTRMDTLLEGRAAA